MRGPAPTQRAHRSADLTRPGGSLSKSVPGTVAGHWNWSACIAKGLEEPSQGAPLPLKQFPVVAQELAEARGRFQQRMDMATLI